MRAITARIGRGLGAGRTACLRQNLELGGHAMPLVLDDHDKQLAEAVSAAIADAVSRAHAPAAVAKRISAIAVRHRNRGRSAAIRKHPFAGTCEASGRPILREDAVLDELEPEKGYLGPVRWVCHKANNSGKRSCGGC